MYVSCDSGCMPLEGLGLTPPPDSEELRRPTEQRPKMEHSEEGSVGPCEGGDAPTGQEERSSELQPAAHFLETLWEGYDG